MYALKIIFEGSDSPQYQLDFNDPNGHGTRVLLASWLQEGPLINQSSHKEERDEEGKK